MDLNFMMQISKPELLEKAINLDDNFCVRSDPSLNVDLFKDFLAIEEKYFSKKDREDDVFSEAFEVLNRMKMNNELDENGEKTYDFLLNKTYKRSLNL